MTVSHTCIGFYSLCLLYNRPKNWLPSVAAILSSAMLFRTLSLQSSDKLETLHDVNCPLEAEGLYSCPVKYSLLWKSVLYHSGIHIFTNIAVLFSLISYGEQNQSLTT